MEQRQPPRVLLIGPPPVAESVASGAEITRVETLAAAADLLCSQPFDAIFADPVRAQELIARYRRDEAILANVDQGIATLDAEGRITWANAVLKQWCGRDPVGLSIVAALSPCTVTDSAADLGRLSEGQASAFRLQQPPPSKHPYLDVRLRPVTTADGALIQVLAIVQNITPEVEQQKKLDALHQAGRDLANLDAEMLADMNLPTRREYLKQNLRKYVHDLLNYDTIEVRLLDPSGELIPLVEDGVTEEAANRRLFKAEFGNGVTGHVAFTGQSYLCPDTAADPLYLEGARGAKSSLTVPLKYKDQVIGTLNVESDRINGFGEKDQQFVELLSKELAAALHTLDLLSAQQTCTVSESLEAVNKEIALPVDEVLGGAARLYARLHRVDPEAGQTLRRIMESARQVKECVNAVHRKLAPSGVPAPAGQHSGKRVLVIDQEERFRRQAHLILRRAGLEVETVADPLEGLALCGDGAYDLIILELKPAGLRGFEAFCRFRAAEPAARICLSTGFGYDSSHTIVHAKQHGLTETLFKPFRLEQILKALSAPPPPPLQLPATAIGS